MEKVEVVLPGRSYEILIGRQVAKSLLPAPGMAVLVTDSHVEPLWRAKIAEQLGVERHFTFPAGEEHKTIESVMALCAYLAQQRLDRQTRLIALGGGVTGDMTGFAAAIFLRGIKFVQIPTSLLAMVDSSVGGKTAVDIPEGKNLVGAFHQPQQVLIDPDFLTTLPPGELRNGLAEVVKTAVILDAKFFDQLETYGTSLLDSAQFAAIYPGVIRRCCELKAQVVAQDETEKGVRAILNYGHTTGHAVELLSNFHVPHGCGVAIGMVVAGRLAVKLNFWDDAAARRQQKLLQTLELPTTIPAGLTPDALVSAMHHDKKCEANKLKFILPRAIGQAEIVADIPEPLLIKTLEECYD